MKPQKVKFRHKLAIAAAVLAGAGLVAAWNGPLLRAWWMLRSFEVKDGFPLIDGRNPATWDYVASSYKVEPQMPRVYELICSRLEHESADSYVRNLKWLNGEGVTTTTFVAQFSRGYAQADFYHGHGGDEPYVDFRVEDGLFVLPDRIR